MTAPISNGPATTRLHHYAGHYYKTLPAHPKWLDLALFLHAGRVLYRCHHQEAAQGEFCTERQSWGSPTGHQAPPVSRVPEGPVWRARAGFEAQPGRGAGGRWWSPAAVSTNNRSTHPKQISHAIPPRHGSMHAQKPQNINDQTSTLEIHSGELHAKLLRVRPGRPQCRRVVGPISYTSPTGMENAGGQGRSAGG